MRLNTFETKLVSHPVRGWWQRFYEVPKLKRLGGEIPGLASPGNSQPGSHVLEVGCGKGVGIPLLFSQFGAKTVDAFDFDEAMVAQASQRLQRLKVGQGPPGEIGLWQGSVTEIPKPDAHYDAVFAFNVLHHVEDWQKGVKEIARVLKPGGKFYAHESLREFIHHPIIRRAMNHPMENRFDGEGFVNALKAADLQPVHPVNKGRYFVWVVSARE